MEAGKYYVLALGNNLYEGMTKEQIIAAIVEATGVTPSSIDDAFITKIKEQNRNNNLKFWIGTTAEYNALETPENNCFYIFTDSDELNEIVNAAADKACSQIMSRIYPVGSIYISVNSTSPATIFGGTWEQIKDTFLLSAGDTYTAGSAGGEAEHTLNIGEMPSHAHNLPSNINYGQPAALDPSSVTPAVSPVYRGDDESSWTEFNGGGGAHNNMPPYLTVYMWKRTA